MRAAIASLTAGLLFASMSCTQQQAATPHQDKQSRPKFSWPAPGNVITTETTTKNGRTAKSRYTIKVANHTDGNSLRLRHEDYEFLEVEGQDAKTPRMQKVLASTQAMASVIPDYRITNTGSYAETVEVDEMIARKLPSLSKHFGDSEEQAARIRAQFLRPEFNELMQGTLSKYWNSWVGEWRNWDVDTGKTTDQKSVADIFGLKVPCILRRTHHGNAPDYPGHVRLSIRTIITRQDATDAMVKLLSEQSDEETSLTIREKIEAVTMTRQIEVITRLDTLQPVWARSDMGTTLKQSGADQPQEKVERHEYTFTWPK